MAAVFLAALLYTAWQKQDHVLTELELEPPHCELAFCRMAQLEAQEGRLPVLSTWAVARVEVRRRRRPVGRSEAFIVDVLCACVCVCVRELRACVCARLWEGKALAASMEARQRGAKP